MSLVPQCMKMQINAEKLYYLFIFPPTTQATIGCLNSAIIGMHSSMSSVTLDSGLLCK
jgi:hypothetical protein